MFTRSLGATDPSLDIGFSFNGFRAEHQRVQTLEECCQGQTGEPGANAPRLTWISRVRARVGLERTAHRGKHLHCKLRLPLFDTVEIEIALESEKNHDGGIGASFVREGAGEVETKLKA